MDKLQIAIDALIEIASFDDYASTSDEPEGVNGGFDSPGDARRARRALKEMGEGPYASQG